MIYRRRTIASDEDKDEDEDSESVKARVVEARSEQGPHEDPTFPKFELVVSDHQVLGVDTDHGLGLVLLLIPQLLYHCPSRRNGN